MENEKWSQQPEITILDGNTRLCSIGDFGTTPINNLISLDSLFNSGFDVNGSIQGQLNTLKNSKLSKNFNSDNYVGTTHLDVDNIEIYLANRTGMFDVHSTIPFSGETNFILTEIWLDTAGLYYQKLKSTTGKEYERFFGLDYEITTPWTNISPKYKVYTALFTQGSTYAPTVNILENTIGDIVWARTSLGQYTGTLSNAFTLNKTVCPQDSTRCHSQGDLMYNFNLYLVNVNQIVITILDDTLSFAENDFLSNKLIEIRVYV